MKSVLLLENGLKKWPLRVKADFFLDKPIPRWMRLVKTLFIEAEEMSV